MGCCCSVPDPVDSLIRHQETPIVYNFYFNSQDPQSVKQAEHLIKVTQNRNKTSSEVEGSVFYASPVS